MITWGAFEIHISAGFSLTALNPNRISLTPQERAEIKEKGRWLRRVINPFTDFYVVMTIGTTGSPTTPEATQRHENRQIRDLTKDL
jgi:hypothetical protein